MQLQPGDRAVVNLPTIGSTDAPAKTTFTVTQAPFPTITINATVGWTWDWGDGSTDSASQPGRPYDGTDPRTSPGHYTAHTYAAPAAARQVTVTATWTGQYTVAGNGASTPINGSVQRTTTRALPVSEYGAALTGN